MTTTINLRKLLHRKAWETCTSATLATTAGGFVVSDKYSNGATTSHAILMTTGTALALYEGDEDAWVSLPSPAGNLTGTFAAGSCGEYRSLGAMGGSFTQTAAASGNSTTTIGTGRTIVKSVVGKRIRVVAGTGVGYEGTVSANTLGANSIVTVTPASGVAFDATTQYQIYSGSFWVWNAGTVAVGFAVYDIATNAWTAKSVTGMPTAWGTGGQLVSTMGAAKVFGSGTATAGAATTLTNGAKSWATNMWANYQIRITGGTGKGQIRTIASNTGTVITVSAAWTVNPDATSTYAIEGNDDNFYLLGNNAVTLYKYVVSTNTWSTLSPTAARVGALAAGGTADWIDNVTGWDTETAPNHYGGTIFKQNGRYIYSFRGGASNLLDVYDIAANTWISGISYGYQTDTFTGGSSSVDANGVIYLTKEATGRIFAFDINDNELEPVATNTNQAALGGTVVEGDKMFILPYTDGATTIPFLYVLRHSASDLVRMMVF